MFDVRNFIGGDDDNGNINIIAERGALTVVEYARDMSVRPESAAAAYFASKMNVHRRQLLCDLSTSGVTLQAGAMQWMIGQCEAKTGVKGVGDLLGKAVKGKVTGESAIKPEYVGDGIVVCEPTYKHLLLTDASEWNGGLVVDDGMFMACENSVKQTIQARSNLSSAVAGGKGLFNLKMVGEGAVCLESRYPKSELVELELHNDVLKIDGPFAICWSGSLQFTVERSTKSLIGSAASGEGLVNVYRGTGKVWMIPVP